MPFSEGHGFIMDLIYLLLVLVLFAAAFGFVRMCGAVRGRS